jgi:CubicO group peptidase (beta-lactamase class C family)
MRCAAVLLLAALGVAGCRPYPPNLPTAPASAIQPATVSLRLLPGGKLESSISGEAGVRARMVTADDPVRIASISKLVTALGVMRLVEEGKLDLDRDVSDYLGWPLRNPAFPGGVINLRMLLSHSSGLRDDAGYTLPLDGSLRELLSKPEAWAREHRPGAYFTYANVGSPVVAAVMERATGEPFDQLMQRLVMRPLKIDGCFNWNGCSAGRRMQAVTLLRPNGDAAKDPPLSPGESECIFVAATNGSCDRNIYRLGENGSAFSPQGGLRISAADLMKVGAVLKNQGAPLLSHKSYAEMTKVHWAFDGKNGNDEKGAFRAYGLGVDMQPGGWIGHVGDAYGMRAGLWVNLPSGEIRMRYVTMVDEALTVGTCLESCP